MKASSYFKKNMAVIIFSSMVIGTIISCGEAVKNKEESHEGHGDHETDGNVLTLTQAQMEAVGITIGQIDQKNLTAVVKASGQLAVPPQNSAQINVLTGGIIRKINVIEGQQVNKGQVLVTLENQDLIKLQQDYLSAKGGFGFIAAEHQRQQQLKAADAGTGKAHQLAEANYNAERAKIKAMERQLQQYGLSVSRVASGNISAEVPVTAPIKGTIGKITAETGSYAQPGVAIMDIVDNSKIHADLIVFEKDLSKIKVGQKVNFQLSNQKNEEIEGEIYGINKSFENDSKGVVVHAVIKKPSANLIPGMYVSSLIGVGSALVSAVPIEAIVRTEGKTFIFAVDKKDKNSVHFKKVEVATGVSELGYIEIKPIEKLLPDVKIITKGAFYLQSKSSGPAAHSH